MKYKIVENGIIEMISTGVDILPGGKLPGERELAEKFGTSRTTVHRAIDSLCKQGILIQRHGNGTYIKDPTNYKYSLPIYSVVRCTEYYREKNMQPVIKVLHSEVLPAALSIAAYLNVEPGSPVLRLDKLFQANRLILNETISYISLSNFPGMDRADFREPICPTLSAYFNVVPRKTDNTIEAVLPPGDVAENLRISTSTPVLLFDSLTSGVMDGEPVVMEYFRTYHRTDRLRFSFSQDRSVTG